MTRRLTPAITLSTHWNAQLEFKLADMWIGCFYSQDDIGRINIWVCLLPCLPIHIRNYKQY
jgi:hypothetical protein